MRPLFTFRAAKGRSPLVERSAHVIFAFLVLVGIASFPTTALAASAQADHQVTAATAVLGQTSVQTAAGVTETGGRPRSLVQPATSKPTREIFGYAMSGSIGHAEWGYPSWNFSLLGTVAYFSIHINQAGQIIADSDWNIWNSSVVTGLINTAHANGTRVVMTIDVHDFLAGNPVMCAALASRATTIVQTVNAVRARGVDGVNVDYEGLNGTCPNGETARSMMTDLVSGLRAALGSGSYISVATYGSSASDPIGFFDISGMSPYADSFFVMAYDLEWSNYHHPPVGCASMCLGPTAPLAGYYWNDTSIVADYLAVVPASKVILGVPYYGRKACVATATPNAYPISSTVAETYLDAQTESNEPAVQPGSYVTHRDVNDPAGLEPYYTWFNTSLGCIRELYIDDAISLGKKYDLVNKNGLRGVGVWTLNYGGGAPELWSALSSHFSACGGVSASPVLASPQPSGTQVHVAAVTSGCATPLYEFWLLPPGGTWTLAQQYTSSPNLYWKTAGLPAGTYRVSVWARDMGATGAFGSSPNTYDAFSAFEYTLTPTCPTVSAASTPLSSATIGSAVTITGTASGCPNPLYQFWLYPPGGPWTPAQPYTSSPNFYWSTAAKAPGSYRFSVWVRDASSPNAYDGFSAFQYALSTTPCTALNASAAPAAAAVGTTVAITGAATGCPNTLYQFWLLPPGGPWTLAQAYSPNPSFSWSTSGLPTGSYRFSVWARDVSSSSSYDAFSAFQYALTPACSAVSVSTVPSTATTVGNNVTVAASASGCPSPLYEVWLLPPGGTWTLGQAYSTSSSFKWPSAGQPAGSYRFSVWARDAGSPNSYDTFNAFQYTVIPVCSAVNVTTLPSTAAGVGNTVTVTAAASGCPSPLYEFWVLPPGGTWTLVQAYSSSAVFKWPTVSKPAGSYRFSVWARDAGSPTSYDAFSAFEYTLV